MIEKYQTSLPEFNEAEGTNDESSSNDENNDQLNKHVGTNRSIDELDEFLDNNIKLPIELRHESGDINRDDILPKKKKKKKKTVSICLSNCRYDAVKRVAYKFNMKEVSESDNWDIYWTDLSISIERAKDMKRFQRINHFPGMLEICRKDLLSRNLNRMLRFFPKEYNIFPKTWCLPADLGDALTYSRLRKNKTYILKPDAGSQGRGIFLTRSLKDLKPTERMICQVYISRPFLVDGFKFDLRVYTLITSCDPLRVFIYNEGLARFATSRYREPTTTNTTNVFMHLTNYAVNKHSRTYNLDDEGGSKRKISTLNRYLLSAGHNVHELWNRIDDVIIKTIIAAWPILKHSYHTCFPCHDLAYACFELLGFDILLDYKLKPYILEVNHSPSFHTDTPIDAEVKNSLLQDTFIILDMYRCDKRKVLEEDRKRVRDRLLQGVNKEPGQVESQHHSLSIPEPWVAQEKWEDCHMGGFRRAYPGSDTEKYAHYFNQTQGSLYSETAASRARDTAARMQRQEMVMKAKAEAAKRLVISKSNEKTDKNSESPISSAPPQVTPTPKPRKPLVPPTILSSFEPGIIVEADEKERIASLTQRDFLIRSYGLLEQIYQVLKLNGALRPEDERKYGLYIKKGNVKDEDGTALPNLNSVQPIQIPTGQMTKLTFPFIRSHHIQDTNDQSLYVKCSEAPIYVRPELPGLAAAGDVRSTKKQVARSLTNTVRMHRFRTHTERNAGDHGSVS